MYLLNTQAEIEWTLDKTSNVYSISDFSTITVQPDGSTDIVQVQNLVASTEDTQGLIEHLFTPNVEGLWEITLVRGTAASYIPLSKASFYVFDSELTIYPLSYANGDLDLSEI